MIVEEKFTSAVLEYITKKMRHTRMLDLDKDTSDVLYTMRQAYSRLNDQEKMFFLGSIGSADAQKFWCKLFGWDYELRDSEYQTGIDLLMQEMEQKGSYKDAYDYGSKIEAYYNDVVNRHNVLALRMVTNAALVANFMQNYNITATDVIQTRWRQLLARWRKQDNNEYNVNNSYDEVLKDRCSLNTLDITEGDNMAAYWIDSGTTTTTTDNTYWPVVDGTSTWGGISNDSEIENLKSEIEELDNQLKFARMEIQSLRIANEQLHMRNENLMYPPIVQEEPALLGALKAHE